MDNGESTTPDENTPPVVLCCASSDEATARTAADALLGRGHEVELVIGVDTGRAELKSAITRLNSQGLYVLCRSGAMPRATIDELRAVLRAQEVPFGRTLTLAIEAKRPRALEERIVSVLRRMGATQAADSDAPVVKASLPQPSRPDPPPKVAAKPAPIVPAPEPFAADTREEPVDADEIAEWADSLVGDVPSFGNDAEAPGPTLDGIPPDNGDVSFSIPAPDYEAVPVTKIAPVEAIRDGNTAIQPIPTDPSLDALQSALPAAAAAVALAPPASSAPVVPPSAPGSASLPAGLSPPTQPPPGVPMLGSTGGGTPSASVPSIPDSELDDEFVVGGPLSRALGGPKGMMVVLGGGAVLLVIVLIVAFSGGDSDSAKVASGGAKAKAEAKPEDKPKDDSDAKADSEVGPEADSEADSDADDGKPNPAADGPGDSTGSSQAGDDAIDDEGLVEPAGDDGSPPPSDDGAKTVVPPEPVAPRREAPDVEHYVAPPEPPAAPTEVVPAGSADDVPAVAEALRRREVRALDLFVVVPEGSDAMAHASAVAYCDAMNIAGLTDWRVPMLGELNSIVAGGLAGKGMYWSSTLGDAFGDTHIIVNARKNRMGAAGASYDAASVLCIRDRR